MNTWVGVVTEFHERDELCWTTTRSQLTSEGKVLFFSTFHYPLYYYCFVQFKNEILFSKQISQARQSTKLPLGGSTRLTMALVSLKNINSHNPDVEPHN